MFVKDRYWQLSDHYLMMTRFTSLYWIYNNKNVSLSEKRRNLSFASQFSILPDESDATFGSQSSRGNKIVWEFRYKLQYEEPRVKVMQQCPLIMSLLLAGQHREYFSN